MILELKLGHLQIRIQSIRSSGKIKSYKHYLDGLVMHSKHGIFSILNYKVHRMRLQPNS